ncbi:MAG: hypothetical protein IJ552_03605 [Prevotella sp.]|nr:hypothetical protein [Prevotella sp.]
MKQTKTEKAIQLLSAGELKRALAIFRTFRMGFTNEERRTMEIASDSLNGHASFYAGLGIDTEAEIGKCRQLLCQKYLQS